MANNKSAKKRNLTNEKARVRNMAYRSAIKTAVSKVLHAVKEGDYSAAETSFRSACSKIAKAVHKGVFKKNTASRKISRLACKIKPEGTPAAS